MKHHSQALIIIAKIGYIAVSILFLLAGLFFYSKGGVKVKIRAQPEETRRIHKTKMIIRMGGKHGK